MPSPTASPDTVSAGVDNFDPLLAFRPLQAAYRAILETVQLPDEYDAEFLVPSREAVGLAWDTLSDCQDKIPPTVPTPTCVALGNGGLTLVWKTGNREVALTIANGGATRTHIYLREGIDDRLESVSSGALTDALRWLVNGGA